MEIDSIGSSRNLVSYMEPRFVQWLGKQGFTGSTMDKLAKAGLNTRNALAAITTEDVADICVNFLGQQRLLVNLVHHLQAEPNSQPKPSHNQNPLMHSDKEIYRDICSRYQRLKCRFGDDCRYKHICTGCGMDHPLCLHTAASHVVQPKNLLWQD